MTDSLLARPNNVTEGFSHNGPPAELPSDPPLLLGERVVWVSDDAGLVPGSVRWLGKLPELGNDWIAGVELDRPAGAHDGKYKNKQLFITKPHHGLIIPVMGLMKEEQFADTPDTNGSIPDSPPSGATSASPGAIPKMKNNSKGHYDNISFRNCEKAKDDGQRTYGYTQQMQQTWEEPDFYRNNHRDRNHYGVNPRFPHPPYTPANLDLNEDSPVEINKLLRQLEIAINSGNVEEAPALARKLAMHKVNCSIIRTKYHVKAKSSNEVVLSLFVEDRTSHIGPINLYVDPTITVGDLKNKIEQQFDFPSKLQRWIIGKQLATDDGVPLRAFNAQLDGCPVFLYLMTTEMDLANAYRRRMEAYLQAIEDLDVHMSSADPVVEGDFADEPVNVEKRLKTSEQRFDLFEPVLNHEAELENVVGWECPACTFINCPIRPGCEVCTTERPEEYRVPDGYVLSPEEENILRKVEEANQIKENEKLQQLQHLLETSDRNVVPNNDLFECIICFTEVNAGEGVVAKECLHNFCRPCLVNLITLSDAPEVKCPYRDNSYACPYSLQETEIRSLVPEEVYERILRRSIEAAETQAPDSFHCKTINCPGWCFFEKNVSRFACQNCGRVNCLRCQVIHEGVNCKEYQDKLVVEARTNEEAQKTLQGLKDLITNGLARKCPNCQVTIIKNGGCTHMKCIICNHDFTWTGV